MKNTEIYLTIGDKASLTSFVEEAKRKTGLLKDISMEMIETSLSDDDFPMKIPVKMDGVLDVAANPILKKIFGKRMEDTTKKYLKAMGVGVG